jgi:hypothetical protein
MNEPRVPAPNPQALFTELDDGTGVLLHLDTKFYYTLNPTAVFVWKALVRSDSASGSASASGSVAAIAEALSQEFQVDRAAAERDVAALLAEMLADGLLLDPSSSSSR